MRIVQLLGSLPKVIGAVWLMDTVERGSLK